MTTEVKNIMNSQLIDDISVILAFGIKETHTLTDDEILANSALFAQKINDKLQELALKDPDIKQVIAAVMSILEVIAKKTKTQWDDRAVSFVKMVLGVVF